MTHDWETLLSQSATDQRELILHREISSLELINASLARIEAVNPAVNAMIWFETEIARAAARRADDALARGQILGPLHGLPVAVKDVDSVAGMPTTCGSPLYRNYVAERDGSIARRLRAAGAIIIGKTNVPEFGAGANTRNRLWGATGNPYNPMLIAGGSSGGSAVALASGMASLCTGTDSGGSLRIPAAMCGVVGFRPSAGRIGSERRALAWSQLSLHGPMGRTVADVQLMLSAMAGLDHDDPLTLPSCTDEFRDLQHESLQDITLLVSRDFGVCDVDSMIAAEFEHRVEYLSGQFRGTRDFLLDCTEASACFEVLRGLDFLTNFRELAEFGSEWISPHIMTALESAQGITAANIVSALQVQTRLFRATQRAIGSDAVLLCPVTPVSPFPWTNLYPRTVGCRVQFNYLDWLKLTYIPSIMGSPAVAIPAGLDANGMPFGLQLIGRHGEDAFLLRVARSILGILAGGEPRIRPPVPNLGQLVVNNMMALTSIVEKRCWLNAIDQPVIFPPPAV